MSLLLPDAGLLFWMLLSFGIVFLVLYKFGFPIITSMLLRVKKPMCPYLLLLCVRLSTIGFWHSTRSGVSKKRPKS